MNRRLCVAVVAAASTILACATPVHAAEEPAGSSFMGPMDLVKSITSGNGSSGVPEEEIVEPEELSDFELSADILGAVVGVVAVIAQSAAFVLPFIPHADKQLGDFLRSIGLKP